MLLLSRVVLRICLRREIWLTVSKAFEKSKAMATVRLGGLFSLKPLITWCVSGSKAVVVDRPSKGTHGRKIFLSQLIKNFAQTKIQFFFFNKFFSNILDILFMLHKEAINRI